MRPATASDDLLIDCIGLTRRFGERVAVADVALRLARGEVLALLGPNGAGKTTTMRMLAGLLAPSAGQATVCGHALGVDDAGNDAIRARCGVVPEAPGFYERLAARDNLAFFGGLQGINGAELDARIAAELERFDLGARAHDRVATFSKGMKQRLSLARALLHRPQLLFLDEPTAGLDPKATAELHARIDALQRDGVGVVISTHSMEEAERLADQVLVLDTRPRYCGAVAALAASEHARLRVRLRGALPATLPPGCVLESRHDDLACFALEDAERDTPALVAALVHAGVAVLAVERADAGLRERYLALVERA